jgi:hypothetical protein
MPKRTIIHVAQDAIRKNTKEGTNEPAIIVRTGARSVRHHSVQLVVDGSVVATFVYSPHNPLSCGARLWLELAEGCDARPV